MEIKALSMPPGAVFIKILRVMKLTATLILLACLHVAAKTHAQNITLREAGVPLAKVLLEIKAQSNYTFWYEDAVINKASPVSISVSDMPIRQVLELLFKNQPLQFEIIGQTIAVTEKPISVDAETNRFDSLPKKMIHVQGVVYNESGQALSGANVIIKALGRGTITNAKGEFELSSVARGDCL